MDKIRGKRGLDGIYIVDELTGLQPDVWKEALTVPMYRTLTLEQLEEVIKSSFPSCQDKEFIIYCSAEIIYEINKMVFEELKKYGRLQ